MALAIQVGIGTYIHIHNIAAVQAAHVNAMTSRYQNRLHYMN